MKTIKLFIIISFIGLNLFAQNSDVIYKLDGDTIVCAIKKVSSSVIEYNLPGEQIAYEIETNKIHKFITAAGNEKVYNEMLSISGEEDYEKVELVYSESAIKGLTKVDDFQTKHSVPFGFRKPLTVEAKVKMQKLAAKNGCHIVYIIKEEWVNVPINTATITGIGYKY